MKVHAVGEKGPKVILMHGFGAPGTDLVPLAQVLGPGRQYFFPEAPIALPPVYGAGRAWWELDMVRMQEAMMRGQPRDLATEYPEQLPEVRAMMVELLDELAPNEPIVLGGFSQGAMLACDIALHSKRPLAGLVLLSGALLAEDWWVPAMAGRAGLPFFQSHGRQDAVLGFGGAERLNTALVDAGLEGELLEFRGGHEIPMPVLQALEAFLQRVCD